MLPGAGIINNGKDAAAVLMKCFQAIIALTFCSFGPALPQWPPPRLVISA